jgi:hypothetical protein
MTISSSRGQLRVIRYSSARSAATSAFSSTGNALKDENDVTGHKETSLRRCMGLMDANVNLFAADACSGL